MNRPLASLTNANFYANRTSLMYYRCVAPLLTVALRRWLVVFDLNKNHTFAFGVEIDKAKRHKTLNDRWSCDHRRKQKVKKNILQSTNRNQSDHKERIFTNKIRSETLSKRVQLITSAKKLKQCATKTKKKYTKLMPLTVAVVFLLVLLNVVLFIILLRAKRMVKNVDRSIKNNKKNRFLKCLFATRAFIRM